MGSVLLASMPLSSPHFPSLALGLLQPAVTAQGIACQTRYFSLDYLAFVGRDVHDALTDQRIYMSHVAEWVFAPLVHDEQDADDTSFLTSHFRTAHPELHEASRLMAFIEARVSAGAFIEACLAAVDWSGVSVLGLTSMFQQTMASLALARRVKACFPHVLVVMGGANCQGEMGQALHSLYPFLDAVCLGEGDRAFPELVRRHSAGESLAGIPGMLVRDGDVPIRPGHPVEDMDALPIPDFDAFFAARVACAETASYPPAVVFETARGCWWGATQHCTFCGLNGVTMRFRAKSQERAYEELALLTARHRCRDVANADNILDMRYFQRFLPRLAAADLGLSIYYEVKANLKPTQISLLAAAGIRKIQAGIETLDTELLRLMRKGSTMLINAQCLKLAAEAGIYVEWLALYGFPGETPAQYDRLARLLPALYHLQPPAAFLRVRGDRFSPYHDNPGAFGATLRALPAYAHIYPFDEATVNRLAYHFLIDAPGLDTVDDYAAGAAAAYARWRGGASGGLWCEEADGLIVHDDRDAPVEYRLAELGAEIIRRCWKITPERDLADLAERRTLDDAIAALAERRLVLREESAVLALPLRQPGFRAAPDWAQIEASVGARASR